MNTREVILKAREKGKCVPAFNVPHIPMVKPIIEAIRDENSVAMIQVARVEWEKMKPNLSSASRRNMTGTRIRHIRCCIWITFP